MVLSGEIMKHSSTKQKAFRWVLTIGSSAMGMAQGCSSIPDPLPPIPFVAPGDSPQLLFKPLLYMNNHIAFGDTDHKYMEIRWWLASQMQELKKNGVDAIFLELPRQEQGIDPVQASTNREGFDYICSKAKECGIKVFFMDVPILSEAAKRGEKQYMEAYYNKREAGQSMVSPTGPDYDAFLEERREANRAWADFIRDKTKEHGLRKSISLAGTYHLCNPIAGQNDFDEYLQKELGSCVRVDIEIDETKGHCVILSKQDVPGPGYVVDLPKCSGMEVAGYVERCKTNHFPVLKR
jgi:hypothetical protein